jgi:hypothetical protein
MIADPSVALFNFFLNTRMIFSIYLTFIIF